MWEQDMSRGGSLAGRAEIAAQLDALLRRALIALGDAGEEDRACRLAAEAWSALRHERPREAERYTGLLHYLTATKRRPRRSANDHRA